MTRSHDDLAELYKQTSIKFRKKSEMDVKIRTIVADHLLEISEHIEKNDERKAKEKLRSIFIELRTTEFGKKIEPYVKKVIDGEEEMPLGRPESWILCCAKCETKYGKDTWLSDLCCVACVFT